MCDQNLSTKKKILEYLDSCTQKEVQSVARYLNNNFHQKLNGNFYLTEKKNELIDAFQNASDVTYKMLFEAVNDVFGSEESDHEQLEEIEIDYYPETYSSFLKAPVFNEVKSKYLRYPHQEECYQQLNALINVQKEKRVLLNVPTGGGKTRIANDFIYEHYLSKGKTVLWITFKGILLHQAWSDIVERYNFKSIGKRCSTPEIKEMNYSDKSTKLNYVTIQALKNNFESISAIKPDVIVVDEVHWGEEGLMAKGLYKRAKNITILGLSATPNDSSLFEKHIRVNYYDLIESDPQILARPEFVHVMTGVKWTPLFTNGIFNKASLKNLGKNLVRNQIIVDNYKDSYGKTLIFACSIDQAEDLARKFNNVRGRSAKAYHSQMDSSQRASILQSYKTGGIQILIGVDALTHGFDIPDIQTIMMARPTESPKLYAQMIGRGSRIPSNSDKKSFNIIEFTDNIEKYADLFCNENKFFGEARKLYETKKRKKWPQSHFYDLGHIRLIKDVSELSTLENLPYRTTQTFGVEFELTCEDYDVNSFTDDFFYKNANVLINELNNAFGKDSVCSKARVDPNEPKDFTKWCVEKDASCGWEITTPILHNIDGFIELEKGMKVISETAIILNLKVNHKTGTHVHLGYRLNKKDHLVKLVDIIRYIEPALSAFVSPSRVLSYEGDDSYDFQRPNDYCLPLSYVFSSEWMQDFKRSDNPLEFFSNYKNIKKGLEDTKYLTMNLNNIESDKGTVEIRWHHGTLDFKKISVWISLWMLLLNKAPYIEVDIPSTDCKIPLPFTNDDKDFEIFIKSSFLDLQPEILFFLKERWNESKVNWELRVRDVSKKAS